MISHPGANAKRPWSDWGANKVWKFIDADVAGSTEVDDDAHAAWPVPEGTYIARLCLDDDFKCIATSDKFQVKG